MSQIAEAIRSLAVAQKPGRGVSLYSRYINRPLGRLLAAVSHAIGLSPNQVTLISAVLTSAGIVMIATIEPSTPMAVGVTAALLLGFAFDSADGQLARLRGGGSPVGEWLDHIVDSGKMVALHGAVLVFLYRFADLPDDRLLLVPLGFQLVAVVMFAGGLIADLLMRGQPVRSDRPVSLSRAVLLLPVDYGVLCFVFLFLAVPTVFVAVYAGLFVVNAVLLPVLVVRWFRRLSARPDH